MQAGGHSAQTQARGNSRGRSRKARPAATPAGGGGDRSSDESTLGSDSEASIGTKESDSSAAALNSDSDGDGAGTSRRPPRSAVAPLDQGGKHSRKQRRRAAPKRPAGVPELVLTPPGAGLSSKLPALRIPAAGAASPASTSAPGAAGSPPVPVAAALPVPAVPPPHSPRLFWSGKNAAQWRRTAKSVPSFGWRRRRGKRRRARDERLIGDAI